jgi:hypothetical protein
MVHEPRRRRSWLIFDVRRFTMTAIRYHSESKHAVGSFSGSREFAFESVTTASIERRDIRPWRFARFTLSFRLRRVFGRCFRASVKKLPVFLPKVSPFFPKIVSSLHSPNKSPEPTLGLVTRRALLFSECTLERNARLAPSPSVAHL